MQSEVPKFTYRLVPFLSVTHNRVQMVDIHNHVTVVSVNIVSVMASRSFSAYARYYDSI